MQSPSPQLQDLMYHAVPGSGLPEPPAPRPDHSCNTVLATVGSCQYLGFLYSVYSVLLEIFLTVQKDVCNFSYDYIWSLVFIVPKFKFYYFLKLI
jgi:hypothetical protein